MTVKNQKFLRLIKIF